MARAGERDPGQRRQARQAGGLEQREQDEPAGPDPPEAGPHDRAAARLGATTYSPTPVTASARPRPPHRDPGTQQVCMTCRLNPPRRCLEGAAHPSARCGAASLLPRDAAAAGPRDRRPIGDAPRPARADAAGNEGTNDDDFCGPVEPVDATRDRTSVHGRECSPWSSCAPVPPSSEVPCWSWPAASTWRRSSTTPEQGRGIPSGSPRTVGVTGRNQAGSAVTRPGVRRPTRPLARRSDERSGGLLTVVVVVQLLPARFCSKYVGPPPGAADAAYVVAGLLVGPAPA